MIELDIVTPLRQVVVGAEVAEVTLPAADGELGILPGHADILAVLGTGVLSFIADGMKRKFAVSYGFVEVRKDRVTVLAETCEESEEIDKDRAARAKQKAEEILSGLLIEGQFQKYEAKVQRATVRQQATE